MCGKNVVEDGQHLFWSCSEASKIWPFVKEIYLNLCNHRLKLDFDLLYWLNIPRYHARRKKYRNIVLYFIILAMYSVWNIRCTSSLNNTKFDYKKVKKHFLKQFRFRLKVDYYRFGNDKFIEKWGKRTTLFTVDVRNGLKLDF